MFSCYQSFVSFVCYTYLLFFQFVVFQFLYPFPVCPENACQLRLRLHIYPKITKDYGPYLTVKHLPLLLLPHSTVPTVSERLASFCECHSVFGGGSKLHVPEREVS